MAKITCQGVEDDNDPLDCLDEDWNGTGLCRYCADIDEHAKGMALLNSTNVFAMGKDNPFQPTTEENQ